MIVDPGALTPAALYAFMISVVVPRPIAFVATVDRVGRRNLAPFSYFNAITNRPPLVGISFSMRRGGPKDTLRNIRDTGEYVVNVVNEALAERMVFASGDWPPEQDEFQLTGLTPVPSDLVAPPRVGECPVSLECRLFREIELGEARFVVGEILRAHVDDAVLVDGRVDPERLRPIGRLGADGYMPFRDLIRIARPRAETAGGERAADTGR